MSNRNFYKNNYYFVNYTKLLLSLLVISIHCPIFFEGNISDVWIIRSNHLISSAIARIAVPYFFISSGFFIFKDIDFSNCNFSFLFKYIKRYLKLYLLWSLFYIPDIISEINYWLKHGSTVVEQLIKFFLVGYYHLWYMKALIIGLIILGIMLYKRIPIKRIFFFAIILYSIGLLGNSYEFIIDYINISPIKSFIYFIKAITVTTRNGVLFGFPFITIGALLSKINTHKSNNAYLYVFLFSSFLLILESFIIKRFFDTNKDMYLMLIPCSISLFLITIRYKSNNHKFSYIKSISTLIYFSHIKFLNIGNYFIKLLSIPNPIGIVNTNYILCVLITIIFSLVIISLSRKEMFSIFKNLY